MEPVIMEASDRISPNRLAGYDNIELTRIWLHRAVVAIHIVYSTSGTRPLMRGFAPPAASGFGCLVYRADLLIALHRHLKAQPMRALLYRQWLSRRSRPSPCVALAAIVLPVNVAGQLGKQMSSQ